MADWIVDKECTTLKGIKDTGSEGIFVQCDVSKYEKVSDVVALYHEKNGAADVLINNAGILHSSPLFRITSSGIERHDIGEWNRVLAADLSSVFYMTVCVAEKMITTRTKGVIVNISSVSASGNAGQSAYSASKAGVNALTATWAKELSPMGIRVVGLRRVDLRGRFGLRGRLRLRAGCMRLLDPS